MTVKVGISGFGRTGHSTFRRIQDVEGVGIVAINDLTDTKILAHLLKYDTTQGRFNGIVEVHEGSSSANGREIKILANRNPEELPWGELGVDIILECAGFFTSKEAAEKRLTVDVRRIAISAPGGNGVPTIAYNTNHETLAGGEAVISDAPYTTNCLAPMAKVLHDNFGIAEDLTVTIHAYIGDQMILDGLHSRGNFRRARATAVNIVPNLTGATKTIGLVIPGLNDKSDGAARRAPVATGPLTELVAVLGKEVTVDGVNAVMEKAVNESYGYNTDEIVSSDTIGMTYGPLFDATQTKVMTVDNKQLVEIVVWHDDGMLYAAQLARTLEYFANL